MKRIVIYGLLLVLTVAMPVKKTDVADLRPVEVIAIYREGEAVRLTTDTKDSGAGADVLQALANMKQTTPAVIYLDTAEYLLIGQGAEEDAQQLRSVLKPNIRLCGAVPGIDLQEAAKYLPVHGGLTPLRHWNMGDPLPFLTQENGRIKMSEKSEKSA